MLTLACGWTVGRVHALVPAVNQWAQNVAVGYQLRVQADPQFPTKSATELVLAVSTQFAAEVNRRGVGRILPELDFVVPGILTAMAGKYYSMWRVAPTKSGKQELLDDVEEMSLGGIPVPTNAFQPTLLDGLTKPTTVQRLGSFVVPIPSLFQAGFLASMVGYGSTALLIALRTLLMPSYHAVTRNVNVLYASVYTGVFVALVSNIRYQLLQGIVEPKLIDKVKNYNPLVYSLLLFAVRTANGLLGANLAIMGMRGLGLQRLTQ